MNKKKRNQLLYSGLLTCILFLGVPSVQVFAATKEPLYTQVNAEGKAIDGNTEPVVLDKPVIRPAYLGSNPYEDYIGPRGKKFIKNPYDPNDPDSQQIDAPMGSFMALEQMGFYQGRPLALVIQFNAYTNSGAGIKADGGTKIGNSDAGYNVRLVYGDGQVKNSKAYIYEMKDEKGKKIKDYESVSGVYLELPLDFQASSAATIKTYFASKKEGLARIAFVSPNRPNFISANVVSENYTFKKADNPNVTETVPALKLDFTNIFAIKQSEYLVIDHENDTALTLASRQAMSITGLQTNLLANFIPPYRDLTYGAPRSLGMLNTDKLEANYFITQAVGIGYAQFYPDSLSIVMDDSERNLFEKIDFNSVAFTDYNGNDISDYMQIIKVDDHKVEFKILKDKLIMLKNNQINIKMSGRGINTEELPKYYNESKNVYEVPMTFYNYKEQHGQKTKSEQLTAIAEIVPNLYGNAVEGVEAFQYTKSSDLDVNQLVKDVATTLPDHDKLTVALKEEDKDIFFDTVKTYNLTVVIHSINTGREKLVTVPVKINKAIPVTSEFFENQAWLIDEINRQLAPKKIDGDPNDAPNTVYMHELEKIKSIKLQDISGNQIMPSNIKALVNLEQLSLANSPGLKGNLPKELGKLDKLTQLKLVQTGISGTIPEEITQLSKLAELDVSGSSLVGNLPEFPKEQLKIMNVSDTQLTYNLKDLPPFVEGAQTNTSNSFVYNTKGSYLQLAGATVKIFDDQQTTIRPFNLSDASRIDLRAIRSENGIPLESLDQAKSLVEGHTYTIADAKTDEVYYNGEFDEAITIPYYKDIAYKVVLDDASNNPNNTAVIRTEIQKQKVIIQFKTVDNEDLDPVIKPIVIEEIIGTVVELSKNEQVIKALNAIESEHYQPADQPDDKVTISESQQTVTYTFDGKLFIESAPSTMSFGTQKIQKGLHFIKVNNAEFDEPLVIWDSRKKSKQWKITATLQTPFTNVRDSAQTLPDDVLRYKKDDKTIVKFRQGDAEVLAERTSEGVKNEYTLSEEWKSGKTGFRVEIPANEIKAVGGYRAKILWQVGNTP